MRFGRRQMCARCQSAVRLAEQRYVLRVAPECCGVSLNPLQCGPLVLQREGPRAIEPGIAEHAEDSQPVVDRHHNDVSDGREPASIEEAAGTDGAIAVDPQHHRLQPIRAGPLRCRQVEEQAVLLETRDVGIHRRLLGADVAGFGRVSRLGPCPDRRGGSPAVIPSCGCGVRDSLKSRYFPVTVPRTGPESVCTIAASAISSTSL